MTATEPRPTAATHEEQSAPSYDRVREAAFSLPTEEQTRLIHELLNRLAPQIASPSMSGELAAPTAAENSAEDARWRAGGGLVTEPPPVGQRDSVALVGMLGYDGPYISDEDLTKVRPSSESLAQLAQAVTPAQEIGQPEGQGNILSIVGRWDFAYDIEDDELDQLLGEARLV